MKFRVTDEPSSKEKELIFNKLLEYNLSKLENKDVKELGIFIEDENNEKIAGLIGETHGNWLEVEYLWVSEKYRGQNIGTELINKAENIGRERGCKYVFLNTFSFQSPKFYEKLGYEEQFVLEEYPVINKRYYYTKKLI